MPDPSIGTEPNALASPYLITLVRDRPARGPAWTDAGSPLRRALSDALGDVRFDVFEWSARDTHRARLKAGRDLSIHLDALSARYPRARRVVIGHGHGGNVILYAAKHAALPQSLDRIVCMATPFLWCGAATRSLARTIGFVLASLLLGYFLVAGSLYGYEFLTRRMLKDAGGVQLAASPDILPAVGIIAVLCYLAMTRYARRRAAASMADLGWPSLVRQRLLSVSYKLDEAGSPAATIGTIPAGVARMIWHILGLLILGLGLLVLAEIGALLAAPLLGLAREDVAHFSSGEHARLTANYSLLVLAACLALAPVAVALPRLQSSPLAYGSERPSWARLLDIRAKDIPIALETAAAEHWRVEVGDFGEGRAMPHAAIHDDPRVQRKIVEWLKG